MDQTEYDRKMAILSLTFGQKVKIACTLTKSRIIPYLLLFLVTGLALGVVYAIIVGLSIAIFPIFLILLLPLPIPVIYFMIGLYSSILKCMDGKEQSFQLSTILEPFKLWKQLLPTVLILFAIWFGVSIVLGIISIIPFIGAIIAQVAMIFLMMFVSAYFFYIADNMNQPTNDLIGTPPKLVTPSINRWIAGVGAYFLIWIPVMILMVIGIVAFVMSDPYFFDDVVYGYYDTPDFNVLPLLVGCLFMLLATVAAYIGGIFAMFMFAIAYKQALLDRERMMTGYGFNPQGSAQGGPQGQGPQTPFNPQTPQGPGQGAQGPQQWQGLPGQQPFNPQAPQAPSQPQPTWQPPQGSQGSNGPEGPGQGQPPNN